MVPNRNNLPSVSKSVQEVQNSSFDETFGVNAIEILLFDSVNSQLVRAKGDANGQLYIANPGGGGAGGATTIADGGDTTEGATTDAAVVGDNTGTVSAKLRGLSKIFNSVWDSTLSRLSIYQKDTTATGTITTTENVAITLNGQSTLAFALVGAFGGTINFEATIDGTNWFTANALSVPGNGLQQTAGNSGYFLANVAGFKQFRVRGNTVNTATCTVTMQASSGNSNLVMNNNNINTNIQSFAQGTFGSADAQANNLNSSLAFTFPFVFNGSTWDRWRGDTTNGAFVNVKSSVLPTGAATEATLANVAKDATLTGGTQKAIARGGAKGSTTAADVTSTSVDVNTQALDVSVKNTSLPVTGTFWQAKQPISAADGDNVTIGAKTDAANSATDATAVSAISVLKQISKTVQAPASTPVTGTFWQATQPVSEADGANTTLGAKADAKNAATDTTAVSAMSVLKQISASVQAPPSQAVTNAGTFAVQATPVTQVDTFMLGGVNVKEINGIAPSMGSGINGTGVQRTTLATDQAAVTTVGLFSVKIDQSTPGTTNAVTDTKLPASAASADGLANPTITQIGADNMNYNGTTWDRQRGNFNTTTGDTGAKSATFNGATQTNFNARGAFITILMGAVTGTTPTCVPQLQWSPDAGTTWLNIGPAMAAITATGNHALFVYPANLSQTPGATPANLTTGAAQTVAINSPLPRTWRLAYTIGGTTPSFTITSVQVNYLL